QAVDRWAEAQVLVHLQCGEAEVHSVQETHDIQNEEERQQSPRHLGKGAPSHLVRLLQRVSWLGVPQAGSRVDRTHLPMCTGPSRSAGAGSGGLHISAGM